MEKVKQLICDLWMDLCFEALKNDIPKKELSSPKQKKFIRNKIFSFLITAANPDSLPPRTGRRDLCRGARGEVAVLRRRPNHRG